MARSTVGVVVLNWNGYRDTIECLESLLRADPRPRGIVVVDNGSHDDSVERLCEWVVTKGITYRVVHGGDAAGANEDATEALLTVLVSATNRGFAGGNNVGVRYLAGRREISHFLLLNNDALVAENFFLAMQQVLEQAPDVALVGSTIFEADCPDRVWYAGGRFHLARGLVTHLERLPPGGDPVPTDFVTGCAMLIGRNAWDAVGELAECYFPLYMEDAEYSYRVGAAGLQVVYAPNAVVYHRIGGTVGRYGQSPTVTYLDVRHRGYFVRRNLRGLLRWVALLYLAATKVGRAFVEVVRGHPRIGWAVLRGAVAGLLLPIPSRRDG